MFPSAKSPKAFCIFGLCLPLTACGQSILSPEQGGTDYAIQGEYLGVNQTTGEPLGAQVSAQGSGAFRALLQAGGFPGAGWDGHTEWILYGSRSGETAIFDSSGFRLSIDTSGDSLVGVNDQGEPLRLVKVHRQSPSLNQAPPAGATILFDGTSIADWTDAILDSNHFLMATGAFSEGGATTKAVFGDFTLHAEFNLPFEPTQSGVNRGNSGIYLQGRYEIQILDSFGESFAALSKTDSLMPRRECGGFWELWAPALNMTYPPLTWQTYDIEFTAARFDSLGAKSSNAKITALFNGVPIYTDHNLTQSTLQGDPEANQPGPLRFQYHGHEVRFRNIWIIPHPSAAAVLPRRSAREISGPQKAWTPSGRRMRGSSPVRIVR